MCSVPSGLNLKTKRISKKSHFVLSEIFYVLYILDNF